MDQGRYQSRTWRTFTFPAPPLGSVNQRPWCLALDRQLTFDHCVVLINKPLIDWLIWLIDHVASVCRPTACYLLSDDKQHVACNMSTWDLIISYANMSTSNQRQSAACMLTKIHWHLSCCIEANVRTHFTALTQHGWLQIEQRGKFNRSITPV